MKLRMQLLLSIAFTALPTIMFPAEVRTIKVKVGVTKLGDPANTPDVVQWLRDMKIMKTAQDLKHGIPLSDLGKFEQQHSIKVNLSIEPVDGPRDDIDILLFCYATFDGRIDWKVISNGVMTFSSTQYVIVAIFSAKGDKPSPPPAGIFHREKAPIISTDFIGVAFRRTSIITPQNELRAGKLAAYSDVEKVVIKFVQDRLKEAPKAPPIAVAAQPAPAATATPRPPAQQQASAQAPQAREKEKAGEVKATPAAAVPGGVGAPAPAAATQARTAQEKLAAAVRVIPVKVGVTKLGEDPSKVPDVVKWLQEKERTRKTTDAQAGTPASDIGKFEEEEKIKVNLSIEPIDKKLIHRPRSDIDILLFCYGRWEGRVDWSGIRLDNDKILEQDNNKKSSTQYLIVAVFSSDGNRPDLPPAGTFNQKNVAIIGVRYRGQTIDEESGIAAYHTFQGMVIQFVKDRLKEAPKAEPIAVAAPPVPTPAPAATATPRPPAQQQAGAQAPQAREKEKGGEVKAAPATAVPGGVGAPMPAAAAPARTAQEKLVAAQKNIDALFAYIKNNQKDNKTTKFRLVEILRLAPEEALQAYQLKKLISTIDNSGLPAAYEVLQSFVQKPGLPSEGGVGDDFFAKSRYADDNILDMMYPDGIWKKVRINPNLL
jgi:hypothetical protein